MKLLLGRIDECIVTGELLELYRDRLSHEALVVRVLQRSPHIVIGERIDEIHGSNGLVAMRISDITRLKRGGRQLEAARSDWPRVAPLEAVAVLELSSALTLLHKRYGYASIYVERLDAGVCFIGEPLDLDDDFVVLRQFGTFKSLDRSELIIAMNEITRVEAGGAYETELMRRFGALSPRPLKLV